MFRRLLNDFQQGVEALRRNHMRLVENKDLVAVASRRETGTLAQFAGVIDAIVRSRVDFDHVDGTGASGSEILARLAFAAGMRGGAFSAIDATRENTRGTGFAASPRPGKQVGVRQLAFVKGPHQWHSDLFLPDNAFERIRAITTIKGQRHNSQHLPVLASTHRIRTVTLPHSRLNIVLPAKGEDARHIYCTDFRLPTPQPIVRLYPASSRTLVL